MGARGTLIDITERKRAVDLLRQTEQRYRRLFEDAPLMYVITRNEKGVPYISDCNEFFLRAVGYQREEVQGKPLGDFYSPESRAQLFERGGYARALAGEFFIGERELVRRDGSLIPTLLYTATEADPSGKVTGTLAMFADITEIKRAEAVLHLRNVAIESSISGISIADLDGNLTYVNAAAQRLWGYDHEEGVLGKRALVFWITEREAEEAVEIATKAGSWIGELVAKRKDGSPLDLQAAITLVRKPDGVPVAVMGSFLDITERKRAEAALRESEAKYRILVETANELICVVQDGRFVFANSKARTDSGYSLDELTSMSFLDVVHPEDRDVPLKLYQQAMSGEEAREATVFRVIHKSGAIRWGLVSVVRVEWDERPAVLVLGTDITDLKKAEETRRESEERYQALFEDSRDAVFVTTRDGRFIDVNQAFCDLFGYDRNELDNLKAQETYTDPADRSAFQEAMEKTGSTKDFALQLRKKDETVFETLLTASVRHGEKGEILGYQGIIRDMTERKQLEKQLLQAQKMEAVGTLAGGIAHDFNNLLQIILGYSELVLLDQTENDRRHKELQAIRLAASRGADLVKQILTFSRRVETNLRPMNLNTEVKQAQQLLTRTIPKMIDIQLLLTDDLNTINADPGQIEQILLNLAVNAQHAMPEGGKIVIQTENVTIDDEYCETHLDVKPGGYALLAVSDTGHGMEKEVLDHIFEPFYSTKTPGEGTGLGLAMVFGIVKGHGGHIECYSEPGAGTTFRIYLPVIEVELRTDVETSQEMPAFGTETILLVDDETLIMELGKRILSRAGYTVLTASNGKEALGIYESKKSEIDLAILDLIMPEMGGKQCLEEILRIDPGAKVLIASGYSAESLPRETTEGGPLGFIGKPYKMKEMLRVVRKVLCAA